MVDLNKRLASFPNSRIKTRGVTQAGTVKNMWICGMAEAPGTLMPDIGDYPGETVTANGNIMIVPADINRTALFIRRADTNDVLRFNYFDDPNILLNGNKLNNDEAFDIDDVTQAIYARSETAVQIKLIVDIGVG